MVRFSIRDVLWLTALVALAVGWWLDRREVQRLGEARAAAIRSHAEALQAALRNAQLYQSLTSSTTGTVVSSGAPGSSYIDYGPITPDVDWSLADKPLPP
ncbi:MAG TPA: hypothetical protein VFB80_15625 [Pirellulaceae bacterium]|nr:hypothetical protein [Pirellulaceae bacterium]